MNALGSMHGDEHASFHLCLGLGPVAGSWLGSADGIRIVMSDSGRRGGNGMIARLDGSVDVRLRFWSSSRSAIDALRHLISKCKYNQADHRGSWHGLE